MTVPILNYTKVSNVNGAQGVLSNIHAFAATQGWTINERLTGRQWVNGVGWTSGGNIDVLDIVSNGWGNQPLHYRWEAFPHASEATVSQLFCTPIIPGSGAYSIATGTRPAYQNDWLDSRWYDWNMPNATFPNLWIFGYQQKYLFWYAQITTEWGIGGAIGTLMLLPEFWNTYNFQFYFAGCFSDNFPNSYWYNIATYAGRWGMFTAAADNTDNWRCMYDTVRGSAVYNNVVRPNLHVARGLGLGGFFGRLYEAVTYNNFTNKYVAIQPTWYFNNSDTSLWHVLGDYPLAIIPFEGLGFGEEIDFGGDTYLAFSSCRIHDNWGFAARIS